MRPTQKTQIPIFPSSKMTKFCRTNSSAQYSRSLSRPHVIVYQPIHSIQVKLGKQERRTHTWAHKRVSFSLSCIWSDVNCCSGFLSWALLGKLKRPSVWAQQTEWNVLSPILQNSHVSTTSLKPTHLKRFLANKLTN